MDVSATFTVTVTDDNGEEPYVEYDPYTPVTVTWPRYSRALEPPISLGLSGAGGYLEVKFDAADRRLAGFVLVSAVVDTRNLPLPVPAFDEGSSSSTARLAAGERLRRALSGDLPLTQIAYDDALEIRIADQPPLSVFPGPTVGFGSLGNGELGAIYLKYSAEQRAFLLENSGTGSSVGSRS